MSDYWRQKSEENVLYDTGAGLEMTRKIQVRFSLFQNCLQKFDHQFWVDLSIISILVRENSSASSLQASIFFHLFPLRVDLCGLPFLRLMLLHYYSAPCNTVDLNSGRVLLRTNHIFVDNVDHVESHLSSFGFFYNPTCSWTMISLPNFLFGRPTFFSVLRR